MNIKEYIKSSIHKFIFNSKITLSGEINILTTDIKNSIIMDDDLFAKIISYAQELRILYPFIKIDVVKELHEISIKLFTLNRLFLNINYLVGLEQNLGKLLTNILETDGIAVKINFNGQIKTWDRIDKFMLVNNKGIISYKITESIQQNELSKTVGKLVDNIMDKFQRTQKA